MRIKISPFLAILLPSMLGLACANFGQAQPTMSAESFTDWQGTVEAFEAQLKPTEAQVVETTPAVNGLWVAENEDPARTSQILVITSDSMYRVATFDPQMLNPQTFARETFYEILEHDENSGHLKVRIRWIRVNGEFGGFDSPTGLMTYQLEGDVLRLALSRTDDGKFPEQAGSVEYYRR